MEIEFQIKKILNILSTLSISGYAIPGVILAIAFITFRCMV